MGKKEGRYREKPLFKKLYQSDTSGQVENTKVNEEESLRNSAKSLNKGTRMRPGKEHKIGKADCLPKT